jgi:non-ribosomal peptide synthetase component F
MAECSFDAHILESLGTLMVGGTVVLLHPHGQMDLGYLSTTLHQHQVTFIATVPSLMASFVDYLLDNNYLHRLSTIRSFGLLGLFLVLHMYSYLII